MNDGLARRLLDLLSEMDTLPHVSGESSDRTELAIDLMTRFVERTGLTSERLPRRYLWSDAFAVCNLLGFGYATGDSHYVELALQLVRQVHYVLGRHRPDDLRTGWLSGLSKERGEAHPTRGGLRIGKPLPERAPDEPVDDRLEWNRDGQYFHYLTKWMHALDQVTRATGQTMFNAWARELACVAHRAFTYASRQDGRRRMYWKLSIDLSRPLVASMGQHDPLDGLVTCVQLEATRTGSEPGLGDAIEDFAAMIEPRGFATADPLGLGGLLVDAYRLAQLARQGAGDDGLVETLLTVALVGLRAYVEQPDPALARTIPSGLSRARARDRTRDAGAGRLARDARQRACEGGAAVAVRAVARRGRDVLVAAGASPGGRLAGAFGHQRRDAGDEPPTGRVPGPDVIEFLEHEAAPR